MIWVVAAPGPSLNAQLASQCRGLNIIAVNDAYRLLPFADVLYAADIDWWRARNGCPGFQGEKLTTWGRDAVPKDKPSIKQFGLETIESTRFAKGFSFKPGLIYRGNTNSGFQAVNVALQRGGNPVIMIGFDMHGTHFFGDYEPPLRSWDRDKQERNFSKWIDGFRYAAAHLPPGRRIINATPGSKLDCFPIMTLQEALECSTLAA